MPPVGFEPAISAGAWPQSYASDRAATVTGVTEPSEQHMFPITSALLNATTFIARSPLQLSLHIYVICLHVLHNTHVQVA